MGNWFFFTIEHSLNIFYCFLEQNGYFLFSHYVLFPFLLNLLDIVTVYELLQSNFNYEFSFQFFWLCRFLFFLIDVRRKGRKKERNGEKHGYERNIYRLPPIQCLRLGIQPGTWVRSLTGHRIWTLWCLGRHSNPLSNLARVKVSLSKKLNNNYSHYKNHIFCALYPLKILV